MTDTEQTRSYRMSKRREDVEQTRRRITEAAVELHGTVGPSETTFSSVAEKAGVQRSTVYRHFPDEEALFGACTSHWLAGHPWPRADDWKSEVDPAGRLRKGLRDLYRYYEVNRDMIFNSLRDIVVMPAFVGELMKAQIDEYHTVLLEAWPEQADGMLAAAVGHAIDFRSWQSLADLGLSPREAADLMSAMVGCMGARPITA